MYRYSEKKYKQSLLNMGLLRVGTLHDFRKMEHKKGVADPQEGKKEIYHPIEDLHITDPNQPEIRALEQFGVFKFGDNPINLRIQGITIARDFDIPNCFILCSSRTLSKETMRQFEGANSCYKIADVRHFYQLLTGAINQIVPVVFRGVFPVVYQDRKEKWNGRNWGRHPALIKEKEFAKQGELRALWHPLDARAVEPLIVGDYRLGGLCIDIPI